MDSLTTFKTEKKKSLDNWIKKVFFEITEWCSEMYYHKPCEGDINLFFYHIYFITMIIQYNVFDLNFMQRIFVNLPHIANLKNTHMNEPKNKQTNKICAPSSCHTSILKVSQLGGLHISSSSLYTEVLSIWFNFALVYCILSQLWVHMCNSPAMSKLQFPCAYPPPQYLHSFQSIFHNYSWV